MSVTEKLKNHEESLEKSLIAEKNAQALEKARKDAAIKVADIDRLKDCVDLIDKFGINQGLVDINRDLLSNRGTITRSSGVHEGSYSVSDYIGDGFAYHDVPFRYMEAKVRLEWFDNNSLGVRVRTEADDGELHPYNVSFDTKIGINTSTGDEKSGPNYEFIVDAVRGQIHKVKYPFSPRRDGGNYSTEEFVDTCEDILEDLSFDLKRDGHFTPKIPQSREEPQKKKRGLFGRR